MMTEKQLEVLRSKNRGSAERPKVELEAQKNTVLVLPKIPGYGWSMNRSNLFFSKKKREKTVTYHIFRLYIEMNLRETS